VLYYQNLKTFSDSCGAAAFLALTHVEQQHFLARGTEFIL
jgi:hypothetical protein